MIRLIATDMDGTFLDGSKQYDKKFYSLFEKMKEKNIIFVIASGNQFYNLYRRFLPVSEDIYYIAENGSFISKGSKELYHLSMDNESKDIIIDILNDYIEIMPVIGCVKKSYILSRYKNYEAMIKRYYEKYEFVDSYQQIHDEILKFSIHDPASHAEIYVNDIQKRLPNHLKIMTSGNEWMDIQYKYVHKGIGIRFIQDLLNISYEESAAFGDQMNDYELLQEVYYAYAMDNAVKEIKDIAYEVVLSNEKQGVLRKIEEILEKL